MIDKLYKNIYLDAENRGKWKLFFDLELKAFGGKTVLTGNLNANYSKNILQSIDSFISEVLKNLGRN